MANLKRNMIELVEEVKEGEIVTKKYLTPPFIPLSVVYEATDLMDEDLNKDVTEKDMLDKLMIFVADKVYGGQFTRDDLFNKLHAPDGVSTLRDQVVFIGQGQQTDATKEFLAKKR